MNSSPLKVALFHILLPLLAGGFIYILWRSDSLLMFRWFEQLGLNDMIYQWRQADGVVALRPPRWIAYSAPDALWVYALTSFMILVWNKHLTRTSLVWITMGFTLGIIPEFLQLLHLFPGTFDINDLSLCALAIILSAILLIQQTNFSQA